MEEKTENIDVRGRNYRLMEKWRGEGREQTGLYVGGKGRKAGVEGKWQGLVMGEGRKAGVEGKHGKV